MRWFSRGRDKDSVTDPKLSAAEERIADLESRSERAAESLHSRLKRNHWGQTVAEIAHGGSRS